MIRKYWGHVLLGTLVFTVINALPVFRSTPALAPVDNNVILSSQLDHDVRMTLDNLKSSKTYRDWRAKGFTPSDVIANSLALDGKDALCDSLRPLKDAELAVFERSLQHQLDSGALPCAQALVHRVDRYWAHESAVASSDSKAKTAGFASISHSISSKTASQLDSAALSDGEIALVFEGSLDAATTREILKTLDQRGVKAIFLVPGQSARDNSELMAKIVESGNSVGSEGTEIRDLTELAMNDARESVTDGAQAVDVAAGAHSRLFSFPLSSSNQTLETLVSNQGLMFVRADIDSGDWKNYDPARLAASVHAKISAHSKGILLLHSDLHQTAIALPAILDDLKAQHRKLAKFEVL